MPRKKKTLAHVIGARIREFRTDRKWWQNDLVIHLDERLQQGSLSAIENGKKYTSCGTIERLAEVFEVEPARFFLKPKENLRHQIADEILGCKEAELRKYCEALGIEEKKP